jgi:carbamoyl-phosphate synthase large subunit
MMVVLKVKCILGTMNINRVFQISDTCAAEFKAKTPYYLDFEAEIEKADGTRYVDNESVTDKKENNCSWVRPK